jgi:sulfite exporter TauE/SafE
MSENISYLSVFIIGLLSGVHCIGMCGGIVGVLSLGLDQKSGRVKNFFSQLFYNLGRISTYTLAGLLFGWIGQVSVEGLASHQLHQILQTFSGVFMILMGLYLAGWWRVLTRVEQAGAILWKRIEPFARRLIPVKKIHHAYFVGMVWGWLPCGLVYSMLTMSLGSGSATNGALLMLAFGLGTLPNLLAMGLLAVGLKEFLRKPAVRYIAGIMVIGFGAWLLWAAWAPMDVDPHAGHQHHHH